MYVEGVDREESRLGGGGGGSTPTAWGIQPKANIGFIKSFLFESMNEKQSNAFLNLSKSDLFFSVKSVGAGWRNVCMCVLWVACMHHALSCVCLAFILFSLINKEIKYSKR